MMSKTARRAILLGTAAIFLGNFRSQAKGGAVKIVVSGPAWYGELIVDDPALLAHLGMAVFEDVEGTTPELPPDLGAGYLLDRYSDTAEDALPFDRVLYFPDPAGGPGYVYYLEIVNGHGPYDGHWFYVSQEGEAAIEKVFDANGVLTSASRASTDTRNDWGRGALAIVPPLAGVLIGWLLGRRERARQSGSRA